MQKREIWPLWSLGISGNWVRRLRGDQISIKYVDERHTYGTVIVSTIAVICGWRGGKWKARWSHFKILSTVFVFTNNTDMWN